MRSLRYLQDAPFLKELTKQQLKTMYVKILILDKQELPISSIEGKVTSGNISINGDSAVRRTGSLSFVASETDDMQLTDVRHLLSMTRKIRIFMGMENQINTIYDKIIWFPLGIFVITQPNISHSLSGLNISLSFKDKMCLLNGECGGGLPASVIFDEYDQIIGSQKVTSLPLGNSRNDYTIYILTQGNETTYWRWNTERGWEEGSESWLDIVGTTESKKSNIFDIVQTLVINYGNENPAKVLISDIPLEIKQVVRFIGSGQLYYSASNGVYTLDEDLLDADDVKVFEYNEDVGYVYTDFTYPGELVSGIGDNIASILEKIKNTLGNYEYFYDIDGNFVFQEIKNYLNTSFSTVVTDRNSIIGTDNYKADFNNSPQSVFTFEQGSTLISSYTNTPSYANIKNDFHIWGENDDKRVIHYHLAIKEKPQLVNEYYVVFNKDENGEPNGTLRLATAKDFGIEGIVVGEEYIASADELVIATPSEMAKVIDDYHIEEETLFLTEGEPKLYIPEDWRVELYMQGLQKRAHGIRPDMYESEILDHLDYIYDFYKKEYKSNIVDNPNSLSYYIDFLEPTERLHDCSVDVLGPRIYSYQQDTINKIYSDYDIPNLILINTDFHNVKKEELENRCIAEGQPKANISNAVYKNISLGTTGYSAQDSARELLHQYTDYNEQISIQSIPMYFLDANTRISVYDKASNIYGDYIIKSISLPLAAGGTMSLSATRALERI